MVEIVGSNPTGVAMQQYRQATLSSESRRLTANVPVTPGVKVGVYVTLSDHHEPDRRWRVDWLSPHRRDRRTLDRARRGAASWSIR